MFSVCNLCPLLRGGQRDRAGLCPLSLSPLQDDSTLSNTLPGRQPHVVRHRALPELQIHFHSVLNFLSSNNERQKKKKNQQQLNKLIPVARFFFIFNSFEIIFYLLVSNPGEAHDGVESYAPASSKLRPHTVRSPPLARLFAPTR